MARTSSSRGAAVKPHSALPSSTQSDTFRGNGGELQQQAHGKHPTLTTQQGIAVADNQNSLRSAPRGPTLLEDFILREKITHFDHERIPERIVHARGTAAHGFFELTHSLKEFTTARVLTELGVQTPLFTRFSTVAGGAGSVDTPRDVRGFAVKFYTPEGNWDLVGNNMPVFFIQDAIKFPDLVHAVKMEPDRGFPQAASAHDTFWDFISLMPETLHTVMWAMSDRALPRSLRMMEGFGIHSFRLLNAAGDSTFVKFHWRPKLGLQSTVWDEALKLQSADNDYHRRDLFESIEAGDFPEWELAVQLFTEKEAEAFPFDHLDPTKLIPEETVPLQTIGRMVLNRWPDNFFCRNRTGGVLPRQRAARHRLQQRPAAAGPVVFVPRHTTVAPGRAQLFADPDQRAQMPVSQHAARRPHADAGAQGPRELRTQQPARRHATRFTGPGHAAFCAGR